MGSKSRRQTVGFRYQMGLHFGISHGPVDRLFEIRAGERIAWNAETEESGEIDINSPGLFGGDKAEGGVVGTADVMMGEDAQTANSYLSSVIAGLMPAFRGMFGLVFRGASGPHNEALSAPIEGPFGSSFQIALTTGTIGSNNPYVKPWSFLVERTLKGWRDPESGLETTAWQPELARIQICGPVPDPEEDVVAVQASFLWDRSRTMLDDPDWRIAQRNLFTAFRDKLVAAYGAGVAIDFVVIEMQHFAAAIVDYNANAGTIGAGFRAPINSIIPYYFQCDWKAGWDSVEVFWSRPDVQARTGVIKRYNLFCSSGLPGDNPFNNRDFVYSEAIAQAAPFTSGSSEYGQEIECWAVCFNPSPSYSLAPFAGNGGSVLTGTTENAQAIADLILAEEPEEALLGQKFAMNPAHIIYQAITDSDWGMGYPTSSIDEESFAYCAQVFFDEDLGLCLILNQQTSVEDFIQIVLDHCNAVIYADPATGKFVLKVIRDDYTVSELPTYDETNIVALEKFERPGYGETVNEITVVYIDRCDTHKDTSITIQDLANIQIQGGVVNQTRQYPGIPTPELALRIAGRDLTAASTPLAKARIRVNRTAWRTYPGEVVVLSWAKLGLTAVVMRVLGVDYGILDDGTITIDLAEDIFGLPESVYAENQVSGFLPPDTRPPIIATDRQDVLEATYYDVARELSATELAAVDQDAAAVMTVASAENNLASTYNIYSRASPAAYEPSSGTGIMLPVAETASAVTQEQTRIPYVNGFRVASAGVGGRVLIGSGRTAELCQLTEIDTSDSSIVVNRAILDTTPQTFAAGTVLWLVGDDFGLDPIERATGETVNVKLTSITGSGESSFNSAIEMTLVPDQRFYRPLPPGNVTVNGQAYPTTVTEESGGTLTVTWSHRDREQQTATFILQSEGNIGPEAGTTYSVYVFDADTETLLDSQTGISGTSFAGSVSGTDRLRVEIASVRDGLEGWQRQIREFDYISEGLISEEEFELIDEYANPFREE